MTTELSTQSSPGSQRLLRRNPFTALRREMEDVFNRFLADWDGDRPLAIGTPSIDLSEIADSFQIRMDVPGFKSDEIDIEVSGNRVRVTGEHKEEKEEKGKTFRRRERRTGSFVRAVDLPVAVNQDRVTAECKDGVLSITLPKSEEVKARKITVKS